MPCSIYNFYELWTTKIEFKCCEIKKKVATTWAVRFLNNNQVEPIQLPDEFWWLFPQDAFVIVLVQLSDGNPDGPLDCLETVQKSNAGAAVRFDSDRPLSEVCNFPVLI